MSAARWPSSSTTNGYHSSAGNAVQTAAESLAYMHDAGARYAGGTSVWPQQSYGHGQQQMLPSSSHSGHSNRASYPQGQLSPDPLAYPPPRAEQHVGPSLPNGGGSFNFPS
ncbi:hypothetical protein TRAPUB_9556 [Trametes pubescens]|uniref:Uncharacterized protein n=1 Tax=Trametes pubescens TaxID=154538 RepID=A0A1M2W203_TRAPU|nr:hypothetical protein TRAPUB_9556 [Trametes pubescens]